MPVDLPILTETVHYLEPGKPGWAPVCGADYPEIILTGYRPDVGCWRCLGWLLQQDIDTLCQSAGPVRETTVIGANLIRLRKARGLTGRQLALRIGHANSGAISQFESGKHIPGPGLLARLAEALGVDVGELTNSL